MSGITPLVLLDEVAAHLDARRRTALYHDLDAMGAQVWMTGTDRSLFEGLASGASRFMIVDSKVTQE